MDFILYCDKTTPASKFPSVTATPSNPKTLYFAPLDLVYHNTGGGWTATAQPGTNSVYSGYTSLDAATKANIVTSIANTSALPGRQHSAVSSKIADLTNGK